MTRKAGETYQASATVVKRKKGVPTLIKVSGEEYVLRHKDQYRDKKSRSVKGNERD